MSFVNKRLPLRLGAGLRISPTWKTRVTELDNGREVRNREWIYPRWRATGSMAAFTADERTAMRTWFVAMAGRHLAFRVRDPIDYVASGETIAPTVGTSTPVQLIKTYDIGGGLASVSVPIQAPVAGTVTVYADGVAVPGALDAETGLYTPDAAWTGTAFTWSGQFDRWMRFDSDENAVQANAMNAFTADIELVEVRR